MTAPGFKYALLSLFALALPIAGEHLYGRAASSMRPQEEKPIEEIVANLAAGRVIVGVFKDGIVIGSIENSIETGSLTPPASCSALLNLFLRLRAKYSPISLAICLTSVATRRSRASNPILPAPRTSERQAILSKLASD